MWNILYFPSHSSHFSLRFIKFERRAKKIFPDESGRELWQNRIHWRWAIDRPFETPRYWSTMVSVNVNAFPGRSCLWTRRNCWKKKGDADELCDIVPASTPRGDSHRYSGSFREASSTDSTSPLWRIYAFYGRTRVRGWLIGGTVKSIERQVKKRDIDRDECKIKGTR